MQTMFPLCSQSEGNEVQLPVILRIFDENQNHVDMHTSFMCINILQNDKAVALKLQEELAGQTMFPLCSQYEKNYQVQLPVIFRIFEENQNPVDMHTSIMCINILKNIKTVGGDSRTNYVSTCISGRTNKMTKSNYLSF